MGIVKVSGFAIRDISYWINEMRLDSKGRQLTDKVILTCVFVYALLRMRTEKEKYSKSYNVYIHLSNVFFERQQRNIL